MSDPDTAQALDYLFERSHGYQLSAIESVVERTKERLKKSFELNRKYEELIVLELIFKIAH